MLGWRSHAAARAGGTRSSLVASVEEAAGGGLRTDGGEGGARCMNGVRRGTALAAAAEGGDRAEAPGGLPVLRPVADAAAALLLPTGDPSMAVK